MQAAIRLVGALGVLSSILVLCGAGRSSSAPTSVCTAHTASAMPGGLEPVCGGECPEPLGTCEMGTTWTGLYESVRWCGCLRDGNYTGVQGQICVMNVVVTYIPHEYYSYDVLCYNDLCTETCQKRYCSDWDPETGINHWWYICLCAKEEA